MIFARLIFQTLGLALGQIRANKFRALLTALGIIIGVSSVTAVIAALDGMKKGILSEVETFGAKSLWVWGDVPQSLRGKLDWQKVMLTREEADALREHCPSLAHVTPITNSSYTVQYGQTLKEGVQVTGFLPSWHIIENRSVKLGRQFTADDDEGRKLVCLVNEKAIDELRLPHDPVGEPLLIKGHRFTIIGVLETKEVSSMFGGGEVLTEAYIPFSTAKKLNPLMSFPFVEAQMTSPDKAEDAKAEIAFVLRNMRGLQPGSPNTFDMQVLQQEIDRFNALAAGITAVAGGVVSISLLVGGIGIMNIMLVSVSERTREIGLRKAVGARPGIVLVQFLVEAVVLCMMGGVIGLVVGQGLTLAMQTMKSANLDKAAVPPWAVFLALGFSASVGVIFGMLPAIKAARLNPIDALRHA